MTKYMTGNTHLPPYLPYPRFLLEIGLTQTSSLIYALFLDRAQLSRSNGWSDSAGRIYIVFPIREISMAIDRSDMTVKNSLCELEAAGLIERKRQGNSLPNRIYVKLPDGQDIVRLTDKKLCSRQTENDAADGQKTMSQTDSKLSPNKTTSNLKNKTTREIAHAYGRNQNVFLTDTELEGLQAELPDCWQQYIERLSDYMESNGKKYQNHAATIRCWARKDSPKRYNPDYSCSEGESL